MAHLSDFTPFLAPLVPGCPAPLADMTVRAVCMDFCTYAPVVQQVMDPLDVYAGQAQYDIDILYGQNVTVILEAYWQGRRMQVIRSEDDLREPGAPYALRQASDNTFTLSPVPTQDVPGAIVVRVATRPSSMASTVDDLLLADYGYEIACGAAARLMLMPGQAFTSPQAAPAFQAIYTVARTNARIRAEAGFGISSQRVRPRSFI